MTTKTRESQGTRRPAVRTLGLYLAVFGAALIFATAIAARPTSGAADPRTNVKTKDGAPVRNATARPPVMQQGGQLKIDGLMLLDVRRVPYPPGAAPKRKKAA